MILYQYKRLCVVGNVFLLAVLLIAFSCSSKKFAHLKKVKTTKPNHMVTVVKQQASPNQIINNPIAEKKVIGNKATIIVKPQFKKRLKQQNHENNFSKRVLPPGLNRQNDEEFKNGALLSLALGAAAVSAFLYFPLSMLLLFGVLLLSLAAIIAGVIAYKSSSSGKAFAVIGIVLGAICLLSLFLLLTLVFVLL